MPDWTIWVLLIVLIIVYFVLRKTTPSRRNKRDFNVPVNKRVKIPDPAPEPKSVDPESTEAVNEEVDREDEDPLDDLESALDEMLDDTPDETDPEPTRGESGNGGSPPPPPPPPRQTEDKVTFGVFTSEGISAGNAFVMDVWAYLMKDFGSVSQMAKMMNRDAAVGMKTGVNIERGTIMTIQLELNGMQVQDPVQPMVWDGDPVNCSFIVNAPQDLATASYPGRVIISSNGIPFASIAFTVQVIGSPREEPVKVSASPQFIKTAFASYASKNREEVLGRIHGMLQVAPDLDVFLDALTLRSGQDWAEQLNNQIYSRDVLYLFWSKEAAASEWVEMEWKLALEKRGISYINPVPLIDPRDAPPPPELGSLHFNDAHVAMIQYERMRQQLKNG